ncbi:MAG: ATP-grasp domain-containing protein [Planctomycetota bacterium]|jgi:ribosomal protein S6--L-glutamate ligase
MRALLLSASHDYPSTQRLLQVFRDRGHEITHAEPARCELGPGDEGRALRIDGHPAGPFDLVVPRLAKPHLEHTFALLEALRDSGAHLLNPLRGLRAARDKYATFRALRRHNIPTPETTLVRDPDRVGKAADAVGGFPVVMKPLHATQGSGVTVVRDADSARTLLRHFLAAGEGAVFQTRIADLEGGDVRLITAGARVVGAIRRRSAADDFRANLHQGALAEPFAPPDGLRDLASRAAGAVGLRFSGVDALVTRKGFHVLEVNASPGLAGFEKATGLDAAMEMVELAERLLERYH